MKRWCAILSLGTALVVGASRPAAASSIQFILDCTVINATVCTAGGPFGSIGLTDNGNDIDVTVTLSTPDVIQIVSLNWLDGIIPVPVTGWLASGGNIGANTVTVSPDNSTPYGRMDIRVFDTSGPLGNPLTFTLSNAGFGNLDVSFFTTRDDVAQLFGAVIGNSGASSPDHVYGAVTAVPEPASLLLLGTGLLTMVRRLRRR